MLGFAFKADTGDTRESAAITLIRNFLSERANVAIYDPKVRAQASRVIEYTSPYCTQVEESQIWFDLQEAMPSTPLADGDHIYNCV